jgi:hypothetical protein
VILCYLGKNDFQNSALICKFFNQIIKNYKKGLIFFNRFIPYEVFFKLIRKNKNMENLTIRIPSFVYVSDTLLEKFMITLDKLKVLDISQFLSINEKALAKIIKGCF